MSNTLIKEYTVSARGLCMSLSVTCRIQSNWVSNQNFIGFLHTDKTKSLLANFEGLWVLVKVTLTIADEEVILHSQITPWLGIWTCNLPRQNNKSRYEITLRIQMWGPYLFQLGEIITTKSLSLLSGLYHCSSYYCHNGPQLDAENRLIYFSFITFQIAATLSLRLSICLYECVHVCIEQADRLLYYLWVSFSIATTLLSVDLSTSS